MAENENEGGVAVAEEEAQWVPDRAPDEYDDDALKATPLFADLREASSFSIGGKKRYLADSDVLSIARDTLKEIWEARESGQDSEDVLALFGKFIERDGEERVIESNNTLILTRVQVGEDDEGNPVWEGRAKLKSSGRGKRFGHDDYARLIGYGEDPESDLAKLAREKLGDRYDGGFLIHKQGMKKAAKNGLYEFRILPPETVTRKTDEGEEQVPNEVCSKFRAELHQYPDDGRKVPVIAFPPRSGDKTKCAITEDRVEVKSMSRMMRQSELNGAQTPAVVFGLGEIQVEGDDAPEGGDNAAPEGGDNAAAALLDDDE